MTTGGSTPLRAVKAGEKPARKKPPPTVIQAAASGDHRSLLVAMRTRIAKAVAADDCSPRDLAALTRRLQDIAKEIEQIDLKDLEEAREDAATADEDWDETAL